MTTGPEGSGYEPYDDDGEQTYADRLKMDYDSMLAQGYTIEEAEAAVAAQNLLDESIYEAHQDSLFGRAGRKH